MEYIVRLTYMDDKFQDVVVPNERLEEFSTCLSSSSIYWLEADKTGFWTDMKNVRHVVFSKSNPPEEAKTDITLEAPAEPDPEKEVKPE